MDFAVGADNDVMSRESNTPRILECSGRPDTTVQTWGNPAVKPWVLEAEAGGEPDDWI